MKYKYSQKDCPWNMGTFHDSPEFANWPEYIACPFCGYFDKKVQQNTIRMPPRTAKKRHECTTCTKSVYPGNKYMYFVGVPDRMFSYFSQCMDCYTNFMKVEN